MEATQREQLAVRFADCMSRLKAIGLKGEVAVSAGVVMVSTTDRNSASSFRKAIKTACQRSGAICTESRKGGYVFAVTLGA